MAQAVVLAAGLSSRAQTNKMALELKGIPVLIRTVSALLEHCSTVFVVTGHYREAVEVLVAGMPGVQCVHNPDYMEGMFTSVKAGVSQTTEDFLLTPGDYPMLQTSTVRLLLEGSGDIRVPTTDGRGGHPIFMAGNLKDELMSEPEDSNLKRFRDRQTITWIPVEDSGSLMDLDTMEDYTRLESMESEEDSGKGEGNENTKLHQAIRRG